MASKTALWDTAVLCHRALHGAGLAHALLGDLALKTHGLRREATAVEMVVRGNEMDKVRTALEEAGFKWNARSSEFRGASGVPVKLETAGERVTKESPIKVPDPGDIKTWMIIGTIYIVRVAKLLEMKLAQCDGRSKEAKQARIDAMELIAYKRLSQEFGRFLPDSVKEVFLEVFFEARAKYSPCPRP